MFMHALNNKGVFWLCKNSVETGTLNTLNTPCQVCSLKYYLVFWGTKKGFPHEPGNFIPFHSVTYIKNLGKPW